MNVKSALWALAGVAIGLASYHWHLTSARDECAAQAPLYMKSMLFLDLSEMFSQWELPPGTSPDQLAISYMIGQCVFSRILD
jgi:hypothetical protein